MMRLFLSLLICIISYASHAGNMNALELRTLYYKANESKESSELFYERIKGVEEGSEPILVAYKAMALFMRSKHGYNPFSKLSDFKRGRQLLEKALQRDAGNIEIRFMRFCVQSQVPDILGYGNNINEDKKAILSGWSYLHDADLKEKIKTFMLKYGHCTVNEKMLLQ